MATIETLDLTAQQFERSQESAVATFRLSITGRREMITCTIDDWPELQRMASKIAAGECKMRDAREYGEKLSALLFPVAPVDFQKNYRDVLRTVKKKKGASHGILRIRLLFSKASALWEIPWEYMLINKKGGNLIASDFLALNSHVSIVRCLDDEEFQDCSPTESTSVLAAFSKSKDGLRSTLNLDEERKTIEETFIQYSQSHSHLNVCDPPTRERVGKKLRAHSPVSVFHFGGHGYLRESPSSGESAIQLQGSKGGSDTIPAEELASLLSDVKTAVINACVGAKRADKKNDWSSVAECLIKNETNAVVAMQFNIFDNDAIAFSRGFYQCLLERNSIDEAVFAGRQAIMRADNVKPFQKKRVRAFGTPVLYLHHRYADDRVWLQEGWDKAYDSDEPTQPATKNVIIDQQSASVVDYSSDVQIVATPYGAGIETAEQAATLSSFGAAEENGRMDEPPDMPPVITGYEGKDEDVLLRVDDPRLFRADQQFLLGDLMIVPVRVGQKVPIKIFGRGSDPHTVNLQVGANGDLTLIDWQEFKVSPLVAHPNDHPPRDWPRKPYAWRFKFYHPNERLMLAQRVTLAFDPALVHSVWRIWHQCQKEDNPKRALNFLVLSSHPK